MTMLQPHEDIHFAERPGDPVLESPEVSTIVGNLAIKLKKAYLFGGQQMYPMYEKMIKPDVGDLVVVTDMFTRRDQDSQHQAVGYLVAARAEWGSTDEEWTKALHDENNGLSHDDRSIEPEAYYIQYGPNAVCRWVNCEVIKAG